jgi:hypothetical protein
MQHGKVLAAVLVLLCPLLSNGQRMGRTGVPRSGGSVSAPPIKGVVISVSGKVKEIAKKQIMIQADDGQIMTFRRTSKTQFQCDGQKIKPTDIDLETPVTVDASEDNDLKLMALVVKAQLPEKKRPLATR